MLYVLGGVMFIGGSLISLQTLCFVGGPGGHTHRQHLRRSPAARGARRGARGARCALCHSDWVRAVPSESSGHHRQIPKLFEVGLAFFVITPYCVCSGRDSANFGPIAAEASPTFTNLAADLGRTRIKFGKTSTEVAQHWSTSGHWETQTKSRPVAH